MILMYATEAGAIVFMVLTVYAMILRDLINKWMAAVVMTVVTAVYHVIYFIEDKLEGMKNEKSS